MIRFDGVTIDRQRQAISYARNTLFLTSPLQFRLACALLLAGPQTSKQLFDRLYQDRCDGGPLSGPLIIHQMRFQLNKKFAAIGLRCDARGQWGNTEYWVAPPVLCEVREAA